MKSLIISHAHPDFSVGGAEIAAYNLFSALSVKFGSDKTSFLARTDIQSVTPGSISQRRDREYIWRQDVGDWFNLQTAYPRSIKTSFHAFLERENPQLVFVQHYAHIGIEFLSEIRATLPDARIVLTLHEYMAICNNQGQMVKTDSTRRLCYSSSPEDCHLCFPEKSPESFWLRKRFIGKHFSSVDVFASPSAFLRDRYIDWGIEPEKIVVIENGQPASQAVAENGDFPYKQKQTIAFFGQINQYKGIEVFLSSILSLSEAAKSRLSFEVHGANLEHQPQLFRETIGKLRDILTANRSIRWVGAYERREMFKRMGKVDWLVVPSIWWENSPMVIQEAFVFKKPVICSDIGGMAEKVQHGVTGLHFEARNPLSLAAVLESIALNPSLHKELQSNIFPPATYSAIADQYLAAAIEPISLR